MLPALLVCSIVSFSASGQSRQSYQEKSAKTIYGELGGPGIFSVNYDQRFKGQKGLGFKVGMGGFGTFDLGVVTVPVGLNYLTGSGGNYLELGAGLSVISFSDGGSFFEQDKSTVFGYLNFGYRYQPEKNGFTGRVFISPLITSVGIFPFYGGVSAGFRF